MCVPQRELGRVVVFIYKGNSSATAESKLLVIGGSGGLTSSLARQKVCWNFQESAAPTDNGKRIFSNIDGKKSQYHGEAGARRGLGGGGGEGGSIDKGIEPYTRFWAPHVPTVRAARSRRLSGVVFLTLPS